MNCFLRTTALAGLVAAGLSAQGTINVSSDITTSTTWTANNTYNLQQQIFVRNGATLTIQAGTLIASTTNLGGSLAVCRGSQIHVLGTEQRPVVFTSTSDVATWTAGNPKTGTWRAAANEWGNLTLMGNAYVSEDQNPTTNTPAPNAANFATMEGLTAVPGVDITYGGGNDNDDSGTVKYCSLRYGGKVIALTNELNGLSVGGVGRGTEIHHVEIMNNIDDGVETWGGTVNYKYLTIWNVGDDSFDVDQGFRGSAQFLFIVQGYSLAAAQGSGWGDNAMEIDGAEQSNYQPVTTTTIYNATVVGCPQAAPSVGGTDHAMALRDGARVQWRNCIFTDIGERVLSFDNVDGDGGQGYGFGGTATWDQVWTTAHNNSSVLWSVNAGTGSGAPAALYTTQTSGNACEISDCVFYNNNFASAYSITNGYNHVTGLTGNSCVNNVVEPALSPIGTITRAAPVIVSGANTIARVTSIDPEPRNSGLTPVAFASHGGNPAFESARFRGAFRQGSNWCVGWTACDAFGFLVHNGWSDLGNSTTGAASRGAPVLGANGTFGAGTNTTFAVSNAAPGTLGVLVIGFVRANTDLAAYGYSGVTLVPALAPAQPGGLGSIVVITGAGGDASWSWNNFPAGLSGTPFYLQALVVDAGSPNGGFAATNAIFRFAQ
ncbi:MAG: hypothetical protein U1E73_13130 [Planctomycetota bacterium]